tara:strand:- start:10869 stop:12209 length:1341 start_codon:yes stop_codon:yes gene_type:complete
MNFARLLEQREAEHQPVRVAVIGCGKFATMYLTQARTTPGIHIIGIADLDPGRARTNLRSAGWPESQSEATSLDAAIESGGICLTEDAVSLIGDERIDVVVEATGIPHAGIRHCQAAIRTGHHVVMVNVEADVLAGPLLAQQAKDAGVIYSLAWGDQPALICEHVDWARSCGFEVTAAGKGTRYLPEYHSLTPDTVWNVLRQYLDIDDPNSINLQMFNSFLDGSKSAIEMTAVCNATGLMPQTAGLAFPPASRFSLADVCKPEEDGGTLTRPGTTEVVSSLKRSGEPVDHHLAMGTFVVVKPGTDYARQCFREYHMLPDESGLYGALYRPTHMIGLELGLSIASVALRGEPTGQPYCFASDVVAVAKRNLKAGEILDGEGGHCVYGKQMPASLSTAKGALPLGLSGGVTLVRDVGAGQVLCEADAALDNSDEAVRARRMMASGFAS